MDVLIVVPGFAKITSTQEPSESETSSLNPLPQTFALPEIINSEWLSLEEARETAASAISQEGCHEDISKIVPLAQLRPVALLMILQEPTVHYLGGSQESRQESSKRPEPQD